MMARTITVHFVRSWEKMTTTPSRAPIQRAIRTRWKPRRPPRPGSSVGCEALVTRSTVPGWRREPGLAEAPEEPSCGVGVGPVEVQALEGGACTRDVRAKGTCGANLGRERRAHEVVRRERGEVKRALDPRQRVADRAAALLPTVGAVARVERSVDVRRRALLDVAWEQDDDPEALRPIIRRNAERGKLAAVTGAELGPVGEEERHVGADPRRERVELDRRERLGERAVREAQRGSGIGAAA